MRLSISKCKNAQSLYVIKSVYENSRRTTKVVEKLGTYDELLKKYDDPIAWAKEYIKKLNLEEKKGKKEIVVKYSSSKQIRKNIKTSFNGGYFFLQKIYHELNLHKICNFIQKNSKIEFDLNDIMAKLVFARILFPGSKLNSFETAKEFIEKPNFELFHIYRALEVFSENMNFIQSELYRNSLNICDRNTDILYYDCTNFFFEIEEANGIKQYGISKENRPNPVVQMGLFTDGNGIPLAFCINDGNTNEQTTLKPLEKDIIKDFKLSEFVICTDAGLSSNDNRKFNSIQKRNYVVTQSLRTLKKHIKEWALDSKGWKLSNSNKVYDINEIDEEIHKNDTFYKERWINENGLEQRLIVTFSIKYKNYKKNIRDRQLERAQKMINNNTLKKKRQNDPKYFIDETTITKDGEIAEKTIYSLDNKKIDNESMYDGFYAVCTRLETDISEIIKINKRRWQIEENFRIMKSEFEARPVYLRRDDRIKAHFLICFISLMIYRILEERLENKFTCSEIISQLKNMNFQKIAGEGYVPLYTRTDFTDELHKEFKFQTDMEILELKEMKKIIKFTKK